MEFFLLDRVLHRFANDSLLGMGSGLTHLGQHVGQLLTLPLGTDVCAQTTLQELEGALVLGHLQQLHATLLVGSVSDDLTDHVAHELGVFGLHLQVTKGETRGALGTVHSGHVHRVRGER